MSSTGLNLNSLGMNQSTATSGSGIDVTAVVNQILDAARAPERLWQQQQSNFTAQSNALTSINSSLSALQTAMQSLHDITGAISANTATSSQTGILTASAQSGAVAGTHLVTVTNLATTASVYTDALANGNTNFQTGVITLQVGTKSADITVDSGNNTLTGLASTINSQQLGVTASVINDSNGSRVALSWANSIASSRPSPRTSTRHGCLSESAHRPRSRRSPMRRALSTRPRSSNSLTAATPTAQATGLPA